VSFYFFQRYVHVPAPLTFPTRRSSDLAGNHQVGRYGWLGDFNDPVNFLEIYKAKGGNNNTNWTNEEYTQLLNDAAKETDPAARRSEEHTSELQSRFDLV